MTDSGSPGGGSGSGSGSGSSGGRKPRLGRGLSSLLGEDEDETRQLDRLRQSRSIPIEQIEPAPYQPRRRFDENELRDLSESIREKGVLQPILLRRSPSSDGYEIIAGERRWRAAQLAQLHEVPALVREFDDDEALEIALIENLQREDLTPLEEAEAFRRLVEEHGQTQEQVARAISKSRSHVANAIRLLALPDSVKALVDDGRLSAGHARALLGADDPAALAEEVLRKDLTVRETERLVQRAKKGESLEDGPGQLDTVPQESPTKANRGGAREKDADTLSLERDLSLGTGLRVEIDAVTPQSGALVIHYETLDQLDDLMERLTRPLGTGATLAMPAALADHLAAQGSTRANFADDGPEEGDDDDVGFSDLLAQTEALLSGSDADDALANSEDFDAESDTDADGDDNDAGGGVIDGDDLTAFLDGESDESADSRGAEPVAAGDDEPGIGTPDVVAAASTTHPSSPDPDDELAIADIDAAAEIAAVAEGEATETGSIEDAGPSFDLEDEDEPEDQEAGDQEDTGDIDLADIDLTTIGLSDIELDDESDEDAEEAPGIEEIGEMEPGEVDPEEDEGAGDEGAGDEGEEPDFSDDDLIVEDETPKKPD